MAKQPVVHKYSKMLLEYIKLLKFTTVNQGGLLIHNSESGWNRWTKKKKRKMDNWRNISPQRESCETVNSLMFFPLARIVRAFLTDYM